MSESTSSAVWSSSVGSKLKSTPLGPKSSPHHDEDLPPRRCRRVVCKELRSSRSLNLRSHLIRSIISPASEKAITSKRELRRL